MTESVCNLFIGMFNIDATDTEYMGRITKIQAVLVRLSYPYAAVGREGCEEERAT